MHIRNAIRDECLALLSFLRFQWGLVVMLVAIIAALAYLANPFPPRRVTIGTGQVNTTFDVLGRKYVEYFRQHGVQLELKGTSGTLENLSLLRQGKIDTAFSLSGVPTAQDNQELISLGSVEFMPLWFFHRTSTFDESRSGPASFLKKLVISINQPASGTYVFASRILSLHGLTPEESPNILSINSKDSVQAYLSGSIDGLFLMGTLDSKSITTILAAPDTSTFNFSMAQAYVKKYPDLGIVSVPRGAIDAEETVIPAQDTQMIAATATILTDERLHPATQLLFLNAARDINNANPSLFSKSGTFPAYLDRATPQSEIAKRYYESGPPFLADRAPYWVASLFDRVWFYLFAFAVFGYPLLRLVPSYRKTYVELCFKTFYVELDAIDGRVSLAAEAGALDALLGDIDALEARLATLWVTSSMRAPYYALRQALDVVRAKVLARARLVTTAGNGASAGTLTSAPSL